MPTVFITGVKNTGFCIAEKFASEGFDVAISTRKLSDVEPLAEMLAKKYNIKARGYSLEMSDVDDIKRVFSCIKEDFGSLDTFVANAANLGVEMDFLTADEDEFSSVVDVNLKGSFFCAQQAALMMKEKKSGSIVFMSSVHSHQCIFGRSLYTASKGGINALTHALAVSLAGKARVNSISPGWIDNDYTVSARSCRADILNGIKFVEGSCAHSIVKRVGIFVLAYRNDSYLFAVFVKHVILS